MTNSERPVYADIGDLRPGGLVVVRKIDEAVIIGVGTDQPIKVTILGLEFDRVKIHIAAPKELIVLREELLYEKRLFVGNLPSNVDYLALRELFAQAGSVEESYVPWDKENRRSKGFGFVEMSSAEEASNAAKMFRGYEINGRKLRVERARKKPEK